ncbi:putative ribonuclease H-like domain-containing protein [Tanacetum coccineum]
MLHYAPEVTLNILSIGLLRQQGFEISSNGDRCTLAHMFKVCSLKATLKDLRRFNRNERNRWMVIEDAIGTIWNPCLIYKQHDSSNPTEGMKHEGIRRFRRMTTEMDKKMDNTVFINAKEKGRVEHFGITLKKEEEGKNGFEVAIDITKDGSKKVHQRNENGRRLLSMEVITDGYDKNKGAGNQDSSWINCDECGESSSKCYVHFVNTAKGKRVTSAVGEQGIDANKKELAIPGQTATGDRIERAATTVSSLEAEQDNERKEADDIDWSRIVEQAQERQSGSMIRYQALKKKPVTVAQASGKMELENSQNNALAKLPILKLGEYEMWEIRIKQYFQIQDYALWEVIENGNSWVPIPVTAPESGPSTALKMTVPSTTEEKMCKKNDVKARSLLLMALPNEHQLTFNQYADAQSMFIAIKARFGGNDATKKTQKALLKQQYENFNATSSESLDSIFNRLQKLVSRLAILGVETSPEDLNVKFLRSLPSEWDTHVVVWMNKPDFETMGLDDLYNNFKIVEQKVKRTVAANNDDKNLAFLTTTSTSSTNSINTGNTGVSTGNSKVNTASAETSTASFSDATAYAFLSSQPQGSQLVHEDLEQIHDDDLEEMDLKWNMALLSMRARKFYQRTGRKIIIDGNSTAGYDKSKVECFNCHKMGHFARECRVPRSKDNRSWNQGNSSKTVRIEDASEKAMCAIDGGGFDWSDMAEDEIQANMALMAFSDSERAVIYEAQVVKYKESEVLFSEEIALLKRSVGHKDYLMGLVKTELEKVKEEKEGVEFKLAKFEKSSKDLDDLLASQVTDKSKKGFGYNAVPSPHPLILNRPTPLDLSYSGLEEFQQPEINWYGP